MCSKRSPKKRRTSGAFYCEENSSQAWKWSRSPGLKNVTAQQAPPPRGHKVSGIFFKCVTQVEHLNVFRPKRKMFRRGSRNKTLAPAKARQPNCRFLFWGFTPKSVEKGETKPVWQCKNENFWTGPKKATFFTLQRGLVARSAADFAPRLERESKGRPAL